METKKNYENFPVRIVVLSNLVSLAVYGFGFLIMLRTRLVFSVFSLIDIFIQEFRLVKNHGTNCYYWGKTCGFGKGRISAWLFRKGDNSKFCNLTLTWRDMIPGILGFLMILLVSCQKQKEEIPEPTVFYSTSFEKSHQADLAGWYFFYDYAPGSWEDTLIASTCPDGGSWALSMKAPLLMHSYAVRYLTKLNVTKNLTLSLWALLNRGQNSITASLVHIRNGQEINSKEINLGVWNNWTKFSFTDSNSILTTDSLMIKITATGSSYEASDAAIDLLKLTDE